MVNTSISIIASAYFKIALWLFANTTSGYHKTREEIEAEIDCITQAQKDPSKFSPIYNRYYDEIFIYVYKRVSDEYTTAEVTSRIFQKCLEKLDKFRYMGVPFSAWLYRIAINEINQFFRRQKSYPRTVSVEDYQLENLFPEFIEMDEEVDKTKVLPKILEILNPLELQMIELRFFEQNSFKEIGYLLNITEVNAKVRTYRILKKLQKHAQSLNLEWDE